MSKSVKINNMVNNLATLSFQKGNRWMQVYVADPAAEETTFVFEAGYDGNPADYRAEYTQLDEVVAEMRESADLRKWNYRTDN